MAIPTTWETLKAEITALSIRDDLEDMIPNFIGYAEKWMQREIFSPEREASTTLTITDNSAPLPSDFGGLKDVSIDGDRNSSLKRATPERLRDLYPTSNTGTPRHFAIEGETILFGPWPTAGAQVVLKYIEGVPPLGLTQPTNWVLTDHPDLYVNAALAELFEHTRDYEEANRRRTLALSVGESITISGRRRKINSGPLAASNPVVQVSRFAKA